MTIGDILEVLKNAVESEEDMTLEDILDYEVEVVLPEDEMDREGIISAIDIDINKRQETLKIFVDLV
jgi:hypothetical protein